MSKHIVCVALAALVVATAATAPLAAVIHGTLVNGTTGELIDGTVTVVNPSGGMMEETQVQAVNGKFTAEGLDAAAGLYLLRSDFDGVMYTAIVRFEGEETAHATVTVYEKTDTFEGIHVLVPHLAAAAVEGELQIEVLYELHNHVEPAATVADLDDQLLIYIPEDRTEVLRSFVSYDEIPIDRFPVPTDEPGIYRIDYPIRPGDTQVGISYAVPYADSTYTLSYKLPHAVESMTVYTINPGMEVSSSTLDLGAGESVHGMQAYTLSNLEKGSTFDLTFRGGGAIDMAGITGEDPHGDAATAGTTVVTLPNRMENPSTLLMVAMLLVMLALIGVTTRGAVDPLAQRERLESFYDLLLRRMARLDDLNEAGAVAHDVYKAKRAELKNQIASVLYQLQGGATGPGDRKHHQPDAAAAGATGRPAR